MLRGIHNIVPIAILIFHCGCYASGYEVLSENPFSRLEQGYSVYLDAGWSKAEAARLLKVFESVSPYPTVTGQSADLQFSRWALSPAAIEKGIQIETKESLKLVTVSKNIFAVEGKNEAAVEEVVAPNAPLTLAIIEFLTDNGRDRATIELILQKRYGIDVPAAGTAAAGERRYSTFENADLMLIISVLETFPEVLRRTPQLQYIVRRIDDDENRGKSTAIIGGGRIEFAESTFNRGNVQDARRVVAHEKTHFLWHYVFSPQLRADWTKLGGWYQDMRSESGWSTTQARSTFVSTYAYEMNPNEDMAESLAYYLVYPEVFRSRYPAKYEFIRDRIMLIYGKRYATEPVM